MGRIESNCEIKRAFIVHFTFNKSISFLFFILSYLISNVYIQKFGKFHAVSDLSLNFYRGEVSSLLGHNGAGKTTTTFILVGMLEATSGSVKVEGLDNRLHIQDIRRIVGFCPQYGRKKKESYF